MSGKLRIGSYNICHGAYAELDMMKLCGVIKSAKLDIVGLQEVDSKTTRSNGIDEPAEISLASGLPYYVFVRSMNFKGGGYGNMILSRYPISRFEIIPLDSGNAEPRSLGYAEINIDGFNMNFFNTHLSVESEALRRSQIAFLEKKLKETGNYILTGDFNTENFEELKAIGGSLVNNEERTYKTFPSESIAIDNIIYSREFRETDSGIITESFSDHFMLWAELDF